MDIVFKQIKTKDFDAVHDLALKAWYFSYTHINKKELKKLIDIYYSYNVLKKFLEKVRLNKQSFLLAFDKRKLVGFCNCVIQNDSGELLGLYIEPALIGEGIGKKLLIKAEEFLMNNKIKKYFTFVNKHNSIGINFYLRNKFKRIPEKDKDDEFESKSLLYIEKEI